MMMCCMSYSGCAFRGHRRRLILLESLFVHLERSSTQYYDDALEVFAIYCVAWPGGSNSAATATMSDTGDHHTRADAPGALSPRQ